MCEVTQITDTTPTPNILEGKKLDGTTEHVDVDDATGHSSGSKKKAQLDK